MAASRKFQQTNAQQNENYAECNLKMALCRNRLASFNSAITLTNGVLDYLNEVLPENKFLKAEANKILGESYLNLGKSSKALEYLKISEQNYVIRTGEKEIMSKFFSCGGYFFSNSTDFVENFKK